MVLILFLAELAFPTWRLWSSGMIGACGGPFSFSRERKAPWDQKKEAGDFQSPKFRFQKQKALDPSPIRLPGIQRKKRSGFQPLKDVIAYENLGSRPYFILMEIK